MNSDHSINKYTSFAYSVVVLWHVTLGRVSSGKVSTCLFFSFCRIKTLETLQKQSKRQDTNCRTWYWNIKTLMTSTAQVAETPVNVSSDNHFSAQDYTYPGDLNLANYEMAPVSKLFFFFICVKTSPSYRYHYWVVFVYMFPSNFKLSVQVMSSTDQTPDRHKTCHDILWL